jgi:hypothetical protein
VNERSSDWSAARLLIGSPAHAEQQWWWLYRSDLSTGVLDSCKTGAVEAFAALSRAGYVPWYVEHKDIDEVDVVFTKVDGHNYEESYFRTLDACQRAAQFFVDQANKYR